MLSWLIDSVISQLITIVVQGAIVLLRELWYCLSDNWEVSTVLFQVLATSGCNSVNRV